MPDLSIFGAWTLVVGLALFGFIMLLLELFIVPGFGFTGLGGVVAILASVVYAGHSFGMGVGIVVFVASFGLSLVALMKATSGKSLSRLKNASISPGKVVDDDGDRQPMPAIGTRGVAITPLRPAGTVEIDGRRCDVIVDGPIAGIGQAVEVLELIGNVVKVRAV
jgi:membrane-bound serine protease (ClpP class)